MNYRTGGAVSTSGRFLRICLTGVLALLLVIFFLLTPERSAPLSCPFHQLTGLSCLTCGITRSLHAATHGDIAASARYHLMGPIVFSWALLGLIVSASEALVGRRLLSRWGSPARKKLIVFFLSGWILFGGIRLLLELLHVAAS